MSPIWTCWEDAMCHVSRVTCHVSRVTCHVSRINLMCHEHLLMFACGCVLSVCRHDECDTSRSTRANRHDDPEVLPGFNIHTHALFMCHTHACMCARQLISCVVVCKEIM